MKNRRTKEKIKMKMFEPDKEKRSNPKKKAGKIPVSKFNNKKTIVDGISFDSRAEADRYVILKKMEEEGVIKDLVRQKKFYLHCPSFKDPCTPVRMGFYRADFCYTLSETGKYVVEDVKGYMTPEYRKKKKWLLLEHGIEIVEIKIK